MLNADQFSLTASDFLWLVVSPELVTHTASRGWNSWCGEAAPSVDLHHYLSLESQQLLRTALLRRAESVDLELTHPTRPARWMRLRLQIANSGLVHLSLLDIHDLVEEKLSLKLVEELARLRDRLGPMGPELLSQSAGLVGRLLKLSECDVRESVIPVLGPQAVVDVTSSGRVLGQFEFPAAERPATSLLTALQSYLASLFEQRASIRRSDDLRERLQRSEHFLKQTNRVAKIGGWEITYPDKRLIWSEQTHHIHGTDPESYIPSPEGAISFYVGHHRERIAECFQRLLSQGKNYDEFFQIQRTDGKVIWIRTLGRVEFKGHEPIRCYGTFQDVDELKRAELENQKIFETLQLQQRATDDGFWDWNVLTNDVHYTDRWKEMLGFAPDELPDGFDTCKKLMHPEDFQRADEVLKRHWEHGLPYRHTSRFRHKDGSWRTILVRANTVRDEKGAPVRVMGVHSDVTELVQLRDQRKKSKLRLDELLNSFHIGVWTWTYATNHVEWDEQMYHLFEIPVGTFENSFAHFERFVLPEDRDGIREKIQRALETNDIFDHVFRIQTKSGLKYLRGNAIAVRDPQGNVTHFEGWNYDVTHELNNAERLRLFERLTDVSPEIIAIANTDHRIIYLNAAARNLGWKLGDNSLAGYSEEYRRLCGDESRPVFDSEGRWAGEAALVDHQTGAEFPVYKRCFQLKNDKGKILAYAIVATDLREKKSLEDEIERQRSIFVQNAKMTALGEMASAIAHEINNPLAILKGQLSVLGLRLDQRDLYLPEAQEFMLAQEGTIERIALIVQGLRDFSRDGANDPYEPLLALDLIKQTLVFCEARFQFNHVALEVGEIPHTLKLVGIKSQLSQALLNLLNNAFDATLKGAPPRSVRVLLETEGLRVRLMVRNSGPAISEELAARIMQPFFTTKEAGKGTGLGLPIARAIVEQHGGRLYLLPHVSETTFVMELPRAD